MMNSFYVPFEAPRLGEGLTTEFALIGVQVKMLSNVHDKARALLSCPCAVAHEAAIDMVELLATNLRRIIFLVCSSRQGSQASINIVKRLLWLLLP